MKRFLAVALPALTFAVMSLGAPKLARADVGDVSTAQLDVEPDGVDATLDLPLAPLERALDKDATGGATGASVAAGTAEVSAYLRDHVHLGYSSDGRAWPARVTGVSRARGQSSGEPTVVAQMHFARPDGTHEDALELTDDAVTEHSATHRVVVYVRRDFEMGKLDGAPQLVGMLQASRQTLTLLRADAGWARGMRAMFALGIDRLMVGPGLLLLWLLLLTAPVVAMHGRWSGVRTTRGAVRALAEATLAYVVGHALSFALGTLGHVQLPAPLTELSVGVSLALVAFHTVRPLGRMSGAWISGLGGVVQGLAFAGTLADVGPVTSAASVVMFTVGVEGLQIFLIALVAPSLVFLRDARVYRVIRAGAASAAAIAALATVAPTPVVLLVAVVALSLTWLAAVTFGRGLHPARASA